MPKGLSIPGVTRKTTLPEAAGRSVLMRLGAVTEALDSVRARNDGDTLRNLRVSLRRLRSTMTAYARAFPEETWTRLRQETSDVFRPTSELRDVDVQLERLRSMREGAPEQAHPGIDQLIDDLASRETGLALSVQRALEVFQSANVLQQVASLVETVTGIVGLDGDPEAPAEQGDERAEGSEASFEADDVPGAVDRDGVEIEVEHIGEDTDELVSEQDADEDVEAEEVGPGESDADLSGSGRPHEIEAGAGGQAEVTLSAQAARARDYAGRILAKRLRRLDRAMGAAIDAMRQPLSAESLSVATDEVLRQVRVGARRLGSTAEIFTPVFGKPLERISRELGDLQDVLGDIHDADVIEDTVLDHLGDLPPTDDHVAGYLYVLGDVRARRAIGQARLERDWTPERLGELQRRLADATS